MADKESRLSLTGRTFTYINLEVQPLITVICCKVGVLMYGLVTVIQHSTNRAVMILGFALSYRSLFGGNFLGLLLNIPIYFDLSDRKAVNFAKIHTNYLFRW